MNLPFFFRQEAWHIMIPIFILIFFAYWLGRKYRKKYFITANSKSNSVMLLETAVFAILGLMLAFIYNAAASRFEANRRIIVEEANCIGTAALRTDLYPENERIGFRKDFKEYVELRIEYYSIVNDYELALRNKERTDSVAKNIWDRATRLSRQPELYLASMQTIPALNSMFDIAVMRDFEYRALIPPPTNLLVVILVISCFFILGYNTESSATAERILLIWFIILITAVIYMIMDLSRTQGGLIDAYVGHQKILDLREMFK
jgi:hypothetical protein